MDCRLLSEDLLDFLLGCFGGCGLDIGHFYGCESLPFAFVSGLHEGIQIDGFLGGDWGDPGAIEADDFDNEGLIAIVRPDLCGAIGSEGRTAVRRAAIADAAKGSDATILPDTGDLIEVFGGCSDNRFDAWAHHSEQRFAAMDTIPEQIRVCGFKTAGRVGSQPVTLPMEPLRTA